MTKAETAKALGISERTLERYTQQNRISVRYEKGKTRTVPVYELNDVRAFKETLYRPTYRPAAAPEKKEAAEEPGEVATRLGPALERILTALMERQNAELERILTSVSERQKTITDGGSESFTAARIADIAAKPVLSLWEAHRLTGIPSRRLKAAITAGRLLAQLNGEWGRGYRMRRADLDKYIADGGKQTFSTG